MLITAFLWCANKCAKLYHTDCRISLFNTHNLPQNLWGVQHRNCQVCLTTPFLGLIRQHGNCYFRSSCPLHCACVNVHDSDHNNFGGTNKIRRVEPVHCWARHFVRLELLTRNYVAAGPTTDAKIHICHFDDENERCSVSRRLRHFKNLPVITVKSITTSTTKGI